MVRQVVMFQTFCYVYLSTQAIYYIFNRCPVPFIRFVRIIDLKTERFNDTANYPSMYQHSIAKLNDREQRVQVINNAIYFCLIY